MNIAGGLIETEQASLDGASVRLALGGTASIPEQNLALEGHRQPGGDPEDSKAFELAFAVRGPWADPVMVPDVQSLIQRSGAAAPLFDAARRAGARSGPLGDRADDEWERSGAGCHSAGRCADR